MKAVYLAGPMGPGPRLDNIRIALLEAARLRAAGFAVFVPHRSAFDELACGPTDTEDWLREGFEWIARCDLLVRLPGASPGSDREVTHARTLGRQVYHGVDDLLCMKEGTK